MDLPVRECGFSWFASNAFAINVRFTQMILSWLVNLRLEKSESSYKSKLPEVTFMSLSFVNGLLSEWPRLGILRHQ